MAEIRLRKVLSRYSKGDLQRVLKELGVEGESTYKRQLVAAAVAQLVVSGNFSLYRLWMYNSIHVTMYTTWPGFCLVSMLLRGRYILCLF